MSLLNYSHTLVAGTPENVNDVQDMFNDVRTLVNGNLDATNLASGAKPADLMGAYRSVVQQPFAVSQGSYGGAGTYYFSQAGDATLSAAATSAPPAYAMVDGAAYAVTGLTAKMRLRVAWASNATAPTGTWTFGLYPVTTNGAAGFLNTTLGTVTAGSTVARATPAASSRFLDAGSDFTIPTSGVYALGLVVPAMAASSFVAGTILLEVRNV